MFHEDKALYINCEMALGQAYTDLSRPQHTEEYHLKGYLTKASICGFPRNPEPDSTIHRLIGHHS